MTHITAKIKKLLIYLRKSIGFLCFFKGLLIKGKKNFLHFTPKPWEQLQNPGSNSKILGELRNPASNSKILGELQNPGETPKPWEQLQNPESIHSSRTECTYSTCCTGLDHAAFILGCVKKNTFNF